MSASPIISPLSMNPLTRDTWGQFDSSAIYQLAPLANDDCYQQKFYKAPAGDQEIIPALGYVAYGLRITPGSIIYGFYQPIVRAVNDALPPPAAFTVQITDVSFKHKWWDDPVSNLFLSNFKPTYQSNNSGNMGSFPNLLPCPYPVVGSGLFMVEIQSIVTQAVRTELVFGVLEVCSR